ncbi:MAG: hypothetical protein KY445_02530 [Armatimonadetes bacterium]|nr:hypothetical protein [Armatimonadota bacterium]
MKRHPLFPVCFALSTLVAACVSQADPFSPDKPVGPVKPGLYEPARGAYLGAALDTTQIVGGDRMKQLTAQMSDFDKSTGRSHALYMHFLHFPNPQGEFGTWNTDANGWIPASQFAQATDNVGATPILTLEPFQPATFLDWKPGSKAFEATKSFAQSAGRWGKPVFIRFAHEMNGSWYPWAEWTDTNQNMKRDPGEDTGFTAAHYRQAYRNMASMFRRYAPNAALIWCPNSGLLGGEKRDVFRPFYPGDDVVDWVGIDIYERGWTLPMPGARLWGGQFAHNLTHDMTDDPNTPQNESVNFYLLYGQWKKKPIMICETAATLSFRTDLTVAQRAQMTRDWKIGQWNDSEYGWLQSVYGTSGHKTQKFVEPIDKQFPQVKAIVWFQIAKREYIPAQSPTGQVAWFKNEWADYRIGGGVEEGKPALFARQEIDLYRALIRSPYYLSRVTARPRAAQNPAPRRSNAARNGG